MITVKLIDLSDLAELIAELLKRGAVANVKKTGDGYWTAEVTGI